MNLGLCEKFVVCSVASGVQQVDIAAKRNKEKPMQSVVNETIEQISYALVGKEEEIRMAICCLLAQGHLLIEDLLGMGKTTLAHALAKVTGLTYQRVQFTSDLLPGDILGFSVFNQHESRFEFQPGPIFNQVLLADEINRATPKTQSALLEAMAENQVTVESATRPLPSPFFVIATQNPVTQAGTFSLPESQLDRFLMRISLGYPDEASEKALYQGLDSRSVIAHLPCTLYAGHPRRSPTAGSRSQSLPCRVGLSAAIIAFHSPPTGVCLGHIASRGPGLTGGRESLGAD